MAALPQQEALQLQPALTQSLDRTDDPATQMPGDKNLWFCPMVKYFKVLQFS